MSIDPASFKTRFPEFACQSDARIQVFIDDSIVILNETFWADKYDLGLSYLTAHFLVIGEKSEAGSITSNGPISSKSVDGVSITYAVPTAADMSEAYYSYTTYGQRYLALRKTLGIAAYVV